MLRFKQILRVSTNFSVVMMVNSSKLFKLLQFFICCKIHISLIQGVTDLLSSAGSWRFARENSVNCATQAHCVNTTIMNNKTCLRQMELKENGSKSKATTGFMKASFGGSRKCFLSFFPTVHTDQVNELCRS